MGLDAPTLLAQGGSPDAVIDAVFVHGLGGDPRGTWTNKSGVFFPAALAQRLPRAAVWSLGYPADSTHWSAGGADMGLHDRALNLLDFLRGENLGQRPLAFIAHSLGGLLVKEMLRTAADQRSFRPFADRAVGVVFLSTPHAGSTLARPLAALGALSRPTRFVAELAPDNEYLASLGRWFREYTLTRGVDSLSYFERRETSGLVVVDRTSGDPALAEPAIGVDEDHESIAKPESAEHQVFRGIRHFLERRIAAASGTAAQRLATPLGARAGKLRELWATLLVRRGIHQQSGGFFGDYNIPAQGRPQVWTSAQALVALLGVERRVSPAPLRAAFEFIEASRLADDRVGWTYSLGSANPTVTDITAWVLLAYAAGLDAELWDAAGAATVRDRMKRDLALLLTRRHASGGFSPVATVTPANLRTYSSLLALWALAECHPHVTLPELGAAAQEGARWLLESYREGLGWVPAPARRRQRERYPGLVAQVLVALALAERRFRDGDLLALLALDPAYRRIKVEFAADATLASRELIANDHVSERDQSLEGTTFRLEGSSFLWCAWSLWALELQRTDSALAPAERERAARSQPLLLDKLCAGGEEVGYNGTWEVAETLLCVSKLEL